MYTVIIIISSPSIVSCDVVYFETKAEAEAYKPIGHDCEVTVEAIIEGELSADEATDYLFD